MPLAPIAIAAIAALPDIIAELQSAWDKYQNGQLTQEEWEVIWNKSAVFFMGAVSGWNAAGQTAAAKAAEK